jgi:hypothetical protein
MAQVEPAEIHAMREEENHKLDDRENRARMVFAVAWQGVPLLVRGEPVVTQTADGRFIAAIDRDLRTALAALDAEGRVASLRAKLNGLEAPLKVEFDSVNPADEIEAAVAAYTLGRADHAAEVADADDRNVS